MLKFHVMTDAAQEWTQHAHGGVDILSRAYAPGFFSETDGTATGAVLRSLISFMHANDVSRVLRWKPADPSNIDMSGERRIVKEAACAIIGAISMHHGTKTALKYLVERARAIAPQ